MSGARERVPGKRESMVFVPLCCGNGYVLVHLAPDPTMVSMTMDTKRGATLMFIAEARALAHALLAICVDAERGPA